MKKTLLSMLLVATALTAYGQQSLDIKSRMQLREMRSSIQPYVSTLANGKKMLTGLNHNSLQLQKAAANKEQRAFALVKLAPGYGTDELEQAGATVIRSRHGFAFIQAPIDQMERVASLKSVGRFELSSQLKTAMKDARAASGVDLIHQGTGLNQAYTGKGVICAIMDNGIDPNHINFLDENGQSRVKYFSNFVEGSKNVELGFYANTPETIREVTTNDATTVHGTHTLGTMAGGYRGPITFVQKNAEGKAETVTANNPYYGVAYGADIAATSGVLYDAVIATGIDDLLNYIEYEKKPAVFNLSIVKSTGPHDGTSLLCQFLDTCAVMDNAIFCIASGNDGDLPLTTHKTLTAQDNELKSFLEGDIYGTEGGDIYMRTGQTSIYSDSNEPFEIEVVLYNKKRGVAATTMTLLVDESTIGTGQYWVSSSYYQQDDNDIIEPILGKYMSGYVGIGIQYDKTSGRFMALIACQLINNPETNGDGNYAIGFIARGKEGQRLDAYCDNTGTWLSDNGIKGWDNYMGNGTISDFATGHHTISVGSYNTATSWYALNGTEYHHGDFDLKTGEMSPFSSYGTLIDGRNLPDVVAPGALIVSSANHYFEQAGYTIPSDLLARADNDRQDFFTVQAGTSMSSPLVAGAVALWLEADPTLTAEEVKEIIHLTAKQDAYTEAADVAQAGAGKFDAYEGLKEVLRRSSTGIRHTTAFDSRLIVKGLGSRHLQLLLAGEKELKVKVLNMGGQTIISQQTQGDETTLDLNRLGHGTYLIEVNGKVEKVML